MMYNWFRNDKNINIHQNNYIYVLKDEIFKYKIYVI